MQLNIDGLEILDATHQKEVARVIKKIIKASELSSYAINICLVDEASMRDLYFRFKKKRKVTDVLSFPLPEMERQFIHTKNMLGDVVICLPQAERQALEFGHSLTEEIAVLCAHGLMHLLGYDHEQSEEEAMIQMQGEMYLLEKAGFAVELSLIGRMES